MTSVKELSRPKTGKGRAAHNSARPSAIHVYPDTNLDSLTAARIQYLMAKLGLDTSRSALIASLAFDGGVI